MNSLDQLKKYTKVVADTGDFESIEVFKPLDATTNPSLILKASQHPRYNYLMDEAIEYARFKSDKAEEQKSLAIDKVGVNFGLEILKIVPGRVSTEVDARLSFDTDKTVAKARDIIALYEENGIRREKILLKIASTWEGIKAAEILKKEGIHCNLTLLFNIYQAIACAEAGVQLISPFVGRIYDWYKRYRGVEHIGAQEDPGVKSVIDIYNYYKKFGYSTEIMGASFRHVGQIMELAGCDLLTISPVLLNELENSSSKVDLKISSLSARNLDLEMIHLTEGQFRWYMNQDAMATEKLAEGIRNFAKDIDELEKMISERIHQR